MHYRLLLLAAIFMVAISSCVRKCTNCQSVELSFVGYDSASLEEVIIKRYTKGSGLHNPIDSVDVFLSKANVPVSYYDTTNKSIRWPSTSVYWNGNTGRPITILALAQYDYEIKVPNAGKVFRLTDIRCADEKSSCSGGMSGAGACQCMNALEAYKLNDSLINTGSTGAVYDFSYYIQVKLPR